MKYSKVIFVCTGNTCRSPMAEFIMKHLWKTGPVPEIFSRGISVFYADSMNEKTREVLEENGIPYTEKVSQSLSAEDIDRETLVLTMTATHKLMAANMVSQFGGSIYTIKEFAGEDGDVRDPYGMPLRAYDLCYLELERLIDKAIKRILQEAE